MNYFTDIEFLNKGYALLVLLIPFLLYFFYKKQKSGINFIFISDIKSIFKRNSIKFYLKSILLTLILLNFIILLANPNITNVSKKIQKNGIDIVIALDISGSMKAEDLKPNRIVAAKNVINNFISKLKTDRLGLVVFAGKPFTSIPLTFDYNILKETISRLGIDNINQQKRGLNGTAIGDAILMAKTLFKSPHPKPQSPHPNPLPKGEGTGKSIVATSLPLGEIERGLGFTGKREKVIILLTDGDANAGVEPVLAGLSAKNEGIKIYTIGIGSKDGGVVNYNVGPFKKQYKVPPLNDKTLKQIAKDTGGVYFRAENNNSFQDIFDELSKLEKNDINIEIKKEYSEYYNIFLYSLLILLSIFTFLMISGIEVKNNNKN